jgi:Rv2525c-like, glycoside hydrolase-like domain/Putative peptidoglycan binding domain
MAARTGRTRRSASRRTTGTRRRHPRPRGSSRSRSFRGSDVRAQGLAVLLVLLALTAVLLGVLRARPEVRTGVMPGSFTGYGFDACEAPSQRAMDAWLRDSPYWAVGIYISGENRACVEQPNLDAHWVATQARNRWRLLPLTVGPQAPCSTGRWSKIDDSPTDGYAAARSQGRTEADGAVDAARNLGIAERSTLWLDMESFDITRTSCRDATLAFVSGWTEQLRGSHYRSGFYSSDASGIRMLERARVGRPGRFDLPHQVWIASWNRRHDTGSAYLSRGGWSRGRVHQYAGTHRETHGGVTLVIDSNFLDVGRGTTASYDRGCGLLGSYPRLREGDRGRAVLALRCLLRRRHLGAAVATEVFSSTTTEAVTRFQRAHGLPATGAMDRHTWVALLSTGPRPLLKYGAGGDAVRRLQRALAAAGDRHVPVGGVFEGRTRAAVQRYQRAHRLRATGVVTDDVWVPLQRGR